MNESEPVGEGGGAGRLRELAALFLKLGVIGFGGPAAHVAMMEDEVVRRRGWLNRAEFLDLLGATNLIPGPNSTELAIHIGRQRAGTAGLLVAGACFILPAMLLVMLCGWIYVRYGALPEAGALLYGVKPVIVAIVVQALYGLLRSALKTGELAALAVIVAVANFLGVHELLLLGLAGLVMTIWPERRGTRAAAIVGGGALFPGKALAQRAGELAPVGVVSAAGVAATGVAAAPFGLWPLFLFFLKIGSVLFGSGYVLLAFLRADLVERWHWLNEAQLLDAIAVGQITPGPVFTTATFIGYLLGGVPGSLLATLGIFLPAFLFVAISAPLLPRLRRSKFAGRFLDGLNAASLALMAVVTWHLAKSSVADWPRGVLAAAAFVLLVRYRVNSAWLVLGGAVLGLATAFRV